MPAGAPPAHADGSTEGAKLDQARAELASARADLAAVREENGRLLDLLAKVGPEVADRSALANPAGGWCPADLLP